MIGQAVISVLDHNEEYTITFPNGYGRWVTILCCDIKFIAIVDFPSNTDGTCACRSILTVPWMELGGKVNVACPKTGYHATVDFHTKVNIKKIYSVFYSLYTCNAMLML